jgi:hypothetical protein
MPDSHESVLERASRSWLEAASKLGIKVIAPYCLKVGEETIECIAFLPDFGGREGMFVAPTAPPDFEIDARLVDFAKKNRLFYSFVNPAAWADYDQSTFAEALQDWGYFGPLGTRPAWLGQPLRAHPARLRSRKPVSRPFESQMFQPLGLQLDLLTGSQPGTTGAVLLSVGCGNAHIVVQTEVRTVEALLVFIAEHRDSPGAHFLEVGRFGPCPVTFTLAEDMIALAIDSEIRVADFPQSAGIYVPRDLLDEFVAGIGRCLTPWRAT